MKLYNFNSFNESNHSIESIKNLCQKYKIINYTINDDFSLDVEGSVDLREYGFSKLPIQFRKVGGFFNCSYNKLTSLQGSPIEVKDFNCSSNQLTSLEYSPIKVRNFYCGYNKLASLSGCPKSVGGSFNCDHNQLTSLEYCPSIGTDFYCNDNLLTSLAGSPSAINGTIGCQGNQLTSFQGSPQKVRDIFCNRNPLISLEGFPEQFENLNCVGTPVEEIWALFNRDRNFLSVFEMYNLFQIPGVIDSAAIEEIAHHLGQTLPDGWTLENYEVI